MLQRWSLSRSHSFLSVRFNTEYASSVYFEFFLHERLRLAAADNRRHGLAQNVALGDRDAWMFDHLMPVVAVVAVEVTANAEAADQFVRAHAIVVDHLEDEIRIAELVAGQIEFDALVVGRIERVADHRRLLLANLLSSDEQKDFDVRVGLAGDVHGLQ